ncbi:MAG: hypothetical protein K6E42_08130 [Synergistes sp.]|nr:hypothetical protein [Synergistes sp.]
MALVTGFLKQTCQWKQRTAEYDAFGQPVSPAVQTIRCRWVQKSGWARGIMGDSSAASSYTSTVTVDANVHEGDTLTITHNGQTVGGVVKAVETIVDLAGREQGRTCYV